MDILSKKDPKFAGLCGVRDTAAKELCKDGIGATVKHTNVFTFEEENFCGRWGVLDVSTPKGRLLNAVFFQVENISGFKVGENMML